MFREEPQAFLALPLYAPNSDLRRAGDDLRNVIEETLHHYGVRPYWPPRDASAKSSIQDLLRETDFVIADITGANPNVLLEVGMALGMGKRVLLLSQGRSSDLPLELAAIQVAVYKPDDVGSVQKYLHLWLRDALSERESSRRDTLSERASSRS